MTVRSKRIKMDVREAIELQALLFQITTGLSRARHRELQGLGLSMIQSAVLWYIRRTPGAVSPAMIGQFCFREPNSVSQLLSRMEEKGVVERIRDHKRNPQNRSLIRVRLTEKGMKVYQQQRDLNEVIPKIISKLTPEEGDTLKRLLLKLRESTFEALDERPRVSFP